MCRPRTRSGFPRINLFLMVLGLWKTIGQESQWNFTINNSLSFSDEEASINNVLTPSSLTHPHEGPHRLVFRTCLLDTNSVCSRKPLSKIFLHVFCFNPFIVLLEKFLVHKTHLCNYLQHSCKTLTHLKNSFIRFLPEGRCRSESCSSPRLAPQQPDSLCLKKKHYIY